MKIAIAASEYAPFAKSGGLADAVASLSQALARRGHDVSAIVPRYYSIDRGQLDRDAAPTLVPWRGGQQPVDTYRCNYRGVAMHFLDIEPYFGRDGIYGNRADHAYDDNLERFAFFSHAAVVTSSGADIMHVHDWPTALVPALVRVKAPGSGSKTGGYPVVLTIHNGGYQGVFPGERAEQSGLTGNAAESSALLHDGTINLLRSGVVFADAVTTVSPTHALELQQTDTSFGLAHLLAQRSNSITGIINGIDTSTWGPERDPHLPEHYSRFDRSGKAACKRALQHELGLPEDASIPIVGMVTRLVDQKGIGPLFGPGYGCAYRICTELPVQLVILGSGAAWCEGEIIALARRLPNLRGRIGYDEGLAHRIEAGADLFLMPSIYEPCGLNQMYSMLYGTLPVASLRGGLADTVTEEVGFPFDDVSPAGIFDAVARAVAVFRTDPAEFEARLRRGMGIDFSWDRSAADYESLFRSLCTAPAERSTRR